MSDYWILDGQRPVKTDDVEVWAKFFEDDEKRRVAKDIVNYHLISTLFLGLDHRTHGSGPPLIFETMVFRMEEVEKDCYPESYGRRCSTWEEAETIHREAVDWVKGGCKDDEQP